MLKYNNAESFQWLQHISHWIFLLCFGLIFFNGLLPLDFVWAFHTLDGCFISAE